jgi:two-component system cell cycle sensor histidine kinase/response regulator CckA
MDTILVLDDEPNNLNIISLLLRARGFDVLEASSGEEAIKVSNNHFGPIPLVVADLQLGTSSGADVAVELIDFRPEMSVLFTSGTPLNGWGNRDRHVFDSFPPNAVDFLEKPFCERSLREKVCRLLQREAEMHV